MSHESDLPLGRAGLIGIAVLGVVLRIGLKIVTTDLSEPQLWEFGTIARNLLETGTYSFLRPGVPDAFMPPAYPLLIWCLYGALGVTAFAHAILATVLLAGEVAFPVLVAWVARSVWGDRVAAVAFVTSLFWPQFLVISGRLHSISLYAPILVAACGVLVARNVPSVRRSLLAGLLLGIYACFRSEGYLFALPAAVALYLGSREQGAGRRSSLMPVAAFAIALAVVVSPWIIRNTVVFGRPVISTAVGMNLLRGNHEEATGTARNLPGAPEDTASVLGFRDWLAADYGGPAELLAADEAFRERAVSFIVGSPAQALRLAAVKAGYFLVADFTHPIGRLWFVWVPSLLALAVGLPCWLRHGRSDWQQTMLWMAFLIQMGVSVVFFVVPRYRMTVDFIPVLFATAWGVQVWPDVARRVRSLLYRRNEEA